MNAKPVREPVQSRRPETAQEHSSPGIGARAWIVALLAQAGIILWVVRTEITGSVFLSSWTLSMPGILLLLTLLTWNAARLGRPLSRAELLGIYVTVSSTVTLAGYHFFQLLIPTLGTGLHLQSPVNQWGRVLEHLPAWLLPQSKEGLRGLFMGESVAPWEIWITPLLAWASLILAVAAASLALNGLLADLWIRQERLSFPIASVPLEISQPGVRLFRNRLYWLGFAVPVALNSLLALNYYYPSIPAVELKHKNLLDGVTTLPLASIGLLTVGFTPFIIGLAFLAPLDVSFSIWFFLWITKAERLFAFSRGAMDAGDLGSTGAPYLNEQTTGAFLALGALILWRALPRKKRPVETVAPEDRALNRLLKIVLGLSLLYIFAFMTLAGFSPVLSLALILLYTLTVLAISRVRSEAGFAWAYGPNRWASSLSHIVVNVHGSHGISPRNLALMGFFHWLWWDLRFALMPAQMDALKIGDAARIRRRQLMALMAIAIVAAIVIGLPWALHDSYRYGWGTAKTFFGPSNGARQSYNMAVNWMQSPVQPRWDRTFWIALGGLFTLFLGLMRQSFAWWPFHPIGYAMSGTLTAESFWGHYFIAWAAKTLLLRYGGLRLYHAALPLVFGLILGDIASQTLWSVGATLLGIPVYSFVQ